MKIHMNTGGLAQTNGYLVLDDQHKAAAIIDAPKDTTEALLEIARAGGYDVKYLLLTHGHWDHLSDHDEVTAIFPKAQVLIHRLDEPKLMVPGSVLFDLPYVIPARKADGYLQDGDKVHIGALALSVLHTPGHCEGHVCFYSAAQGVLFSGDLLMAGTVGRYDLAEGDIELLKKSIRRVLLLPDHTHVLSGHGPATTIGRERAGNPFVREYGLGTKE